MLDQSFSADNFQKIFDDENRKGNDLASRFFPKVKDLNNKIRNENIKLRKKKSGLNKLQKAKIREDIREEIKRLVEKRDVDLKIELENLEEKVSENTKNGFAINLIRDDTITSKPVYLTPNEDAVSYFIIKQIQRNIRKLYKVKQSDRHQIVSQLSLLLDNKFPKHLIRTDIKEFYESIPHDSLLEIIEHENLLSYTSKQYIKSILKEYKVKSGSEKGLPRGIGISAYLAELYMREFDRKVKSDGEVIFYARYVDDIVVLYAPKPDSKMFKKFWDIKLLAQDYCLKVNFDKTKVFPKTKLSYKFDYLGYEFNFDGNKLILDISKNKLEKYKKRVDLSFQNYENTCSKKRKLAAKLLFNRLTFLTSNTKLFGSKTGTLIGVYFSNKLINEPLKKLKGADCYLQHKINELKNSDLKEKLEHLSFVEGFKNKSFHTYSRNQLEQIIRVWS